ncbi:MAG: hypothetical protein IKL84_00035 [Clostridia bacterium]|nr:hypothetical protein [Clostridia bacterium]
MQPSKKLVLLCCSILAVFALAVCIIGALLPDTSAKQDGKEPDVVSEWQLLYPDAEWGESAADRLADELSARISETIIARPLTEAVPDMASIVLAPQADAAASPQSRAELLDRAGKTGYTISHSKAGRRIALSALSAEGAQAAIDAFCAELDKLSLTALADAALTEKTCAVKPTEDIDSTNLITTDIPLNFNADGRFKILLASNLSAGQGESPSPYTITALQKMLETEQPDLVLLCGGVAHGFSTREAMQAYLSELVAPLERAGIPWAHLYAGEDLLSRAVKDSVYAEFDHCISKSGDYFLPIYANGAPVFGVWMMSIPEDASLTYHPEQLAALTAQAERLAFIAGNAVPSLMALAYPLPEFVEAASALTAGEIGEAITIPATNCGLFELAAANGSRAIYAGGNPLNSYTGTYNEIELGALAALGYDSYGFGGTFETNNRLRGARVVELDLSDLSTVTSRMVYAADLGIER